jgi:hypothetical protein
MTRKEHAMTTAIPHRTAAFGTQAEQLGWYATGASVAFLIPFVFSSVLDLNHDVYYAVYFAGVVGFLGLYVRSTGADVGGFFRQNARWSLGLGLLAAAFVVFNVLNREDSTPYPGGAYFAFEIGWRGVLYGTVDALLLTAFTALVAFAILEKRVSGLTRRLAFAAVAFVLVVVITATYHLGYEQFREDGVSGPEIGNTIISVPALVSVNPVGSIVAHASMHVAAVAHAYETEVFLPPQTDAE